MAMKVGTLGYRLTVVTVLLTLALMILMAWRG